MLFAFPPIWLLLLALNPGISPIHQRTRSNDAAVVFESGAQLHAYRIERGANSIAVNLYLSPARREFDGLGYSIHLVNLLDNESVVAINKYASEEMDFQVGPGFAPVYRQWAKLAAPESAHATALKIVLSLWRDVDGNLQPETVVSSDHSLFSDTQVVLHEFVLPAARAAEETNAFAKFTNGFSLAPIELPERVDVGEVLTIPFTWRADATDSDTYIQFLHFGHESSGEWWTYDQEPLGPRLPTRFWYSGLVDSEVWKIPLPADLAPGRYSVFTGLYRVSDKERLPATRDDGTLFIDAHLPLGSLIVERAE